ncbi:CooT family nickel-binding protein [Methanosarcina mazei]|uniref:CooT family nickel-binding protein n=1 Tax=Methanosarcina mazei TaxID=2209 RepID=UPI0032C065F1
MMCEINVILLSGENRERIMDSVARILVEGDTIQFTGILGDKMTVEGSVKEINFSRGEAIILSR